MNNSISKTLSFLCGHSIPNLQKSGDDLINRYNYIMANYFTTAQKETAGIPIELWALPLTSATTYTTLRQPIKAAMGAFKTISSVGSGSNLPAVIGGGFTEYVTADVVGAGGELIAENVAGATISQATGAGAAGAGAVSVVGGLVAVAIAAVGGYAVGKKLGSPLVMAWADSQYAKKGQKELEKLKQDAGKLTSYCDATISSLKSACGNLDSAYKELESANSDLKTESYYTKEKNVDQINNRKIEIYNICGQINNTIDALNTVKATISKI